MNPDYSFNENISIKLKNIIRDYNGGEIFFGCKVTDSLINDIEPICYGNDEAVLAPYEIAKKFNAILHNHPSGDLKPSDNDLYYANYLINEGIGFFITDNEGNKLNTVVPPVISKKKDKIDREYIRELFSADGKISDLIDDYEYREGQAQMACEAADALNEDKLFVIEAGTGIGKSIAYLIPAFIWIKKNNERIVISTNTINLQSQLVNKDIPLVKKILDSDIMPVVVKGRQNYLCKLKIYNLSDELEFDDDAEELNSILKWSNITNEGVLDELNFIPKNNTWDKVSSDADFCTGRHCIFFQKCFFQIARRKASESNLLIVNHHILFADVDIRSKGRGLDENILLPPYRKIIFDEAHNIVKSASSFFSISFSKAGFYKYLSQLRKKNNRGYFPSLYRKLYNTNIDELIKIAEFIENDLLGTFSILFNSSFIIFDAMKEYFNNSIIDNSINNGFEKKVNRQYRIKKDEWEGENFQKGVIDQLKSLCINIDKLEERFETLLTKFQKLNDNIKENYSIDIKLIKAYQNKLVSIRDSINDLINIDTADYITWLEFFGNVNDSLFRINATPLYIERLLCQHVYDVFDTIVFSSATLTVNNNFDFFTKSSGLSLVKDKNVECIKISSPFDYQNNVLFVAPVDIPEPASNLYNEKLNNFLKKSINISNGSTFVLFTSYNQLKKSFEDVGSYLNDEGLTCLYQGEMEKSKLLNKFVDEVKSTLFATNSFWEGVDAPGKTLKYVVLAKLPFSIPTEPVEEARIEELEKRGLNPFLDYTLPSAVLRFRQGFGRLIRKKDDYGVVAVLDSRVLKKFYGKIFFQSIPRCKFISGYTEEVIESIREHLALFEQ